MKQFKVVPRTEQQLKIMRESGQITASALKKAVENAQAGVTLAQVDKLAEDEILRLGAASSFKTVPGYYWTSCLTLNDEVVHGIPREIALKKGDILGIDLGAVYQGWHTDAAWSVEVGNSKQPGQFLSTGEEILWKAISCAIDGNRIGDISSTIQTGIESAGYSVVKSLCGHGVGRSLHEDPEVPGYGKQGAGMVLKTGMTLAIEVIYTAGTGSVYQRSDGWTIASEDGSIGGLFEMSIIVGKDKPELLTDWRNLKM